MEISSLQEALAGTQIILIREGDTLPPAHILFDGIRCRVCTPMGESDQVLAGFYNFMNRLSGDLPLVVQNFLERIDESTDLTPVIEALKNAGRPVSLIAPNII